MHVFMHFIVCTAILNLPPGLVMLYLIFIVQLLLATISMSSEYFKVRSFYVLYFVSAFYTPPPTFMSAIFLSDPEPSCQTSSVCRQKLICNILFLLRTIIRLFTAPAFNHVTPKQELRDIVPGTPRRITYSMSKSMKLWF